ncbi:leucine-rich repeat domain-containing protein [Faecalibacterium sp. An121]|uniref:leucine-rich repeat domain-containing protein n=1 Tax=Faecalibacterium sp. An121 TaxID=1965550 RepID=UPI000B38B8E5|nr:leucine-rich repeat domain-containing protein [Faecalibacterium sp. An121]OUQ40546.1 hypothetical protein B5E66_01320 [Faecalibacterium sp. An121]
MRLRRPIAFILSAAVAASALTGCDSFSGHAAAAANSAQVQQLIEFIADLGLERDLRQALQKGGDLRQALLTLLGLESAVNFNVDDLTGARPGQHAVQVWEVTAQSAEDAAALAASQIRAVLEQLKSNGVTEGRIGMVEVDGKYYVVVDVEVTEENTFEPVKPVSDDDDSEDTPSASAPTATVGGMTIDLSELDDNEITAAKILELAGKVSSEKDSITELDLSGCTNLTTIDNNAFDSCKNLTTVTLPSSVTSIGKVAFAYSGLTSINLSGCKNLTSIGFGAFGKCKNLTSINLSGCTRLESIDESAFISSGLTEINLGGCTSLQRIGNYAFENSGLTSITLPASLTTIGTAAFWGCSSLKNITFYNVPEIGDYAFYGVISDNDPSDKLIIHCPEGCSGDLQQKLIKSKSFTEDDINNKISFDETLTPLAYLLGL